MEGEAPPNSEDTTVLSQHPVTSTHHTVFVQHSEDSVKTHTSESIVDSNKNHTADHSGVALSAENPGETSPISRLLDVHIKDRQDQPNDNHIPNVDQNDHIVALVETVETSHTPITPNDVPAIGAGEQEIVSHLIGAAEQDQSRHQHSREAGEQEWVFQPTSAEQEEEKLAEAAEAGEQYPETSGGSAELAPRVTITINSDSLEEAQPAVTETPPLQAEIDDSYLSIPDVQNLEKHTSYDPNTYQVSGPSYSSADTSLVEPYTQAVGGDTPNPHTSYPSPAVPKSPYNYSADVESELERAVEIDPSVDHELIHSVINDEEVANNLISDAIIAESIIALTSIAESGEKNADPFIEASNIRNDFAEGDLRNTAIVESSLEALAASETQITKQESSTQEVDIEEDDVTFTLTEKKWASTVFVYVSEAEEEEGEEKSPKNPREVNVKIATEFVDNMADTEIKTEDFDAQAQQSINGFTENTSYNSGLNDNVNIVPQEPEITIQEQNNTEDTPEIGTKDLTTAINGKNALHDGDDGTQIRRLPESASDTDGGSTEDMTDTDTKAEVKANGLQVQDTDEDKGVFSGYKDEETLRDLRSAILKKEAVVVKTSKIGYVSLLKKPPSDAILQYQERRRKYGRQEENGQPKVNGSKSYSNSLANHTHLHDNVTRGSLITESQVRPLVGFKPVRAILVEGIVNKTALGFSISLQTTEPPDKADVALLFSPNCREKNILCNTYFHDTWGAPQLYDKKFPFSKGKKFVIKIATDSHCFKISVNGHHILDYDHRMPLNRVKYLRLEGDAIFNNVECPFALDLPYVLDVEHGFRDDSGISIDAFIWPKASMFELNLLCAEKTRHTHASFLMKVHFLEGQKVKVEMLSFCNNEMGEPGMVEGDLSIQPGNDVKMRIIMLNQTFSIEVDGSELAVYDHNLPIEHLGHVLVDGDISVYSIRFLRPSRRRSSGLVLSTAYQDDTCCPCSIT